MSCGSSLGWYLGRGGVVSTSINEGVGGDVVESVIEGLVVVESMVEGLDVVENVVEELDMVENLVEGLDVVENVIEG